MERITLARISPRRVITQVDLLRRVFQPFRSFMNVQSLQYPNRKRKRQSSFLTQKGRRDIYPIVDLPNICPNNCFYDGPLLRGIKNLRILHQIRNDGRARPIGHKRRKEIYVAVYAINSALKLHVEAANRSSAKMTKGSLLECNFDSNKLYVSRYAMENPAPFILLFFISNMKF